ncbi:MAG: radical SAM protein [Candidatus Caldarchaeum sp.]
MRKLRELVLDITNKCPMQCLHCSASSTPLLNRFISYEKAAEVIIDAAGLGLEIISFTGGEPLVHPRLKDMVRLACSLGVKDIRIFTSGLRYVGKHVMPLDIQTVKDLAEAGVKKVFFNLQGASPKTHESITLTSGSFDAVITGTSLCKNAGLYVGFHFVPMKMNWRELDAVVSLAKRLDVDEVGVLKFVPQGRGFHNRSILELDNGEFQAFLKLAASLIRNDGKPVIRLGCPFNSIARLLPGWVQKRCPAASEMCHVLISGAVAPCSAFKYQDVMKGGNIYTERLSQIWLKGFPVFESERLKLSAEYSCTAQEILAKKLSAVI